jgi:hypothetical protein
MVSSDELKDKSIMKRIASKMTSEKSRYRDNFQEAASSVGARSSIVCFNLRWTSKTNRPQVYPDASFRRHVQGPRAPLGRPQHLQIRMLFTGWEEGPELIDNAIGRNWQESGSKLTRMHATWPFVPSGTSRLYGYTINDAFPKAAA